MGRQLMRHLPPVPVALCAVSLVLAGLLSAPVASCAAEADGAQYFGLTFLDGETGSPIEAVEVTTTNHVALRSDRWGRVAFYEPGLMAGRVFFYITRQGYESPRSGFGFPGASFDVTEGGSAVLTLEPSVLPGAPPPSNDGEPGPGGAWFEDPNDVFGVRGGAGGPPVSQPVPPAFLNEASRLLREGVPDADEYFALSVVDAESGRGVPGIEVRSDYTSDITDNAGLVAFHQPVLMNRSLELTIGGHGYAQTVATVTTQPGARIEIAVERLNVAERLYRVTGAGMYRDSVLLGESVRLERPVLNAMVTGQDSVEAIIYRGRIFWIWGDTDYPTGPLGNFRATAATSAIPEDGRLDVEEGVDLEYFVDANGFARAMAPLDGPGAVWLAGPVVLRDAGGERLFARFARVLPGFDLRESGGVEFDDATGVFEKVYVETPENRTPTTGWPFGLSVRRREFVYWGYGARVRARPAQLFDARRYQVYTPYRLGRVKRYTDGAPRYAWKLRGELPTAEAIDRGDLDASDVFFGHVQDVETGTPVIPQGFRIAWNPYRDRFIRVVPQLFGSSSILGEVWYLEGDTPMGPWVYGRRIMTHQDYSFYNVAHHPFFDKQGGRIIFFEGTYTNWLSLSAPTPRYNYNQIMYTLDLERPELNLPVPVYVRPHGDVADDFFLKRDLQRRTGRPYRVPFFALERPAAQSVPIYATRDGGGLQLSRVATEGATPIFHALPADLPAPPPVTVPLWEFVDGRNPAHRAYTVDAGWSKDGWGKVAEPVCLVWRSPIRARFPVGEYLADSERECCR